MNKQSQPLLKVKKNRGTDCMTKLRSGSQYSVHGSHRQDWLKHVTYCMFLDNNLCHLGAHTGMSIMMASGIPVMLQAVFWQKSHVTNQFFLLALDP